MSYVIYHISYIIDHTSNIICHVSYIYTISYIIYHIAYIMCHISYKWHKCHMLYVICHISYVICHISYIIYHISYITYRPPPGLRAPRVEALASAADGAVFVPCQGYDLPYRISVQASLPGGTPTFSREDSAHPPHEIRPSSEPPRRELPRAQDLRSRHPPRAAAAARRSAARRLRWPGAPSAWRRRGRPASPPSARPSPADPMCARRGGPQRGAYAARSDEGERAGRKRLMET